MPIRNLYLNLLVYSNLKIWLGSILWNGILSIVRENFHFFFLSYNIRRHPEIHSHNTRNKFIIPRNRTHLQGSRHILRNYVSVVLNSVGHTVLDKVNTHSYGGFCSYAKRHILSSYSLTCNIDGCYVCGT